MKNLFVAGIFSLILMNPAVAEPIPAYVLDKDFQNCMGGEDPAQSPQRANYCECIRAKMTAWDLDTYGAVATEQAQAGNHPVASISDMAKECISQALK